MKKKTNHPIERCIRDINKQFTEKEMQIAFNYIKRWSTLPIAEMQIKLNWDTISIYRIGKKSKCVTTYCVEESVGKHTHLY